MPGTESVVPCPMRLPVDTTRPRSRSPRRSGGEARNRSRGRSPTCSRGSGTDLTVSPEPAGRGKGAGAAGEVASDAQRPPKKTAYDSQEDIWIACACSAASFCLYLSTLYPRVPGGDSGELIAAAYQVGVGHPPGYPLFCIVEKILCSLLFFGERTSIAYRMNIGNALLAASTSGVLYLTALPCVMGSSPVSGTARALAVLAAGLFALNPCVWTYSTHAEVFALNNLLVSALLYLTVRFMRTRDIAAARAGALIMGLGLTNQHTIIIFEVPLALGVLVEGGRAVANVREICVLLGYFLLGFSVYLYLPAATWAMPYVSWGDGCSLQGFLRQILRVEYGSFRLSADENEPGRLYEGLHFWVLEMRSGFPAGMPLMMVLGVAGEVLSAIGRLRLRRVWRWVCRKDKSRRGQVERREASCGIGDASAGVVGEEQEREEEALSGGAEEGAGPGAGARASVWLLGALGFYLVFFHSLANLPLFGRPDNVEIIRRFWMQPATICVILMVLGVKHLTAVGGDLLDGLRCRPARGCGPGVFSGEVTSAAGVSRQGRWGGAEGVGVWVVALLVSATLGWWGQKHFTRMDMSENQIVEQFGYEVLRYMPPNALFLTMTDLVTNTLRYLQVCDAPDM